MIPFAVFGIGAAELVVISILLCVLQVFAVIPALLAYLVLNRVPPQFRKQKPGLAFLLLIPIFSIVWAFFVHPRVADSLKAYFDSQAAHAHQDCGSSLALWLCISGVIAVIPFLGFFAGIASLILLLLFYVKVFELSARIPRNA